LADLKALTDTTKKSTADSSKKSMAKKEDPKYSPEETWVKVYYKKDNPSSTILLKGARIITMKGDEVIAKGDVIDREQPHQIGGQKHSSTQRVPR